MKSYLACFCVLVAVGLLPAEAKGVESMPSLMAYVGPGAGLGAIGALLAVLAAIALGIVGLILYPIQLVRSWLSTKGTTTGATTEIDSPK